MSSHPQWKAFLALGAVCFFWGTTYLGIRVALETFPPAMLVSSRYLISGGVMLLAAAALRIHIPRGRELALTSLYGIILIGLGNGALAFAEQWIPSGLAAMFITTLPFWMIGIEAALPGGERLHAPTVIGMLIGLGGTLLLVGPGALSGGLAGPVVKGFLVLQLGCAGWALGSILQRRHKTKAHPIINGAAQQFATGVAFIGPAFLLKHAPVHVGSRGVSAVLYLAVFGAIVGYSAYIYSLAHLPVAVVSLYNYVTPVVAVLLGFIFYKEPVGIREIAAMSVIFAGVWFVKRFSAPSQKPATPQPASPDAEPQHTAA